MPTNVASTALTMKPAVHVQPVRTSASRAAFGLVPLRYRLRPGLVRASTTPMTTAISAQMATTGGIERPHVLVTPETPESVHSGAVPLTEPLTHPVSTPVSSEPTPSGTLRGAGLDAAEMP